MKKGKYKIIILGAGMAGLGAAIALKKSGEKDFLVLEKNSRYGGLFSNTFMDGCDFDMGPKILLLDESKTAKEILSFLGSNFEKHPVVESVYLKDLGLLNFPLQRHLIELPGKVRNKVIKEITNRKENSSYQNFKDWLIKNYGKYLSEKILIPYEQKKWQMDLQGMDYKWALSRPVKVDKDEVIKGAYENLGPNRWYWYPKKGNISILTKNMAKYIGEERILLNNNVTRINLEEKYVISNGKKYHYEYLISTIPLQHFVKVSFPMPHALRKKALTNLNWLGINVFNLVFKGNFDLKGTAIYFPEREFIFRRVSILENLCPPLGRKGKTPISIEVSINSNVETDTEGLYRKVLRDLKKIPQFALMGDPISYEVITIPNAYPLQSLGLREIVEEVSKYHSYYDVLHAGRGGTFDYSNGDVAYKQGQEASELVLRNLNAANKEAERELSVTVGIPSYKSSYSIVETVKSLRKSEGVGSFRVLIAVDGEMDLEIEKELSKLDVEIRKYKTRGGQTLANKRIAMLTKTDLLIMTQDDVVFEKDTLSKIVDAFKSNRELTMIAPLIEPLEPKSLMERALRPGVKAVQRIAKLWNKGDNYLSSIGRCLAYRTDMVQKFLVDEKIINCDAFYYFENKRLGGKFKYLVNAKVYYRSPSNMDEHLKQVRKFVVSQQELSHYLTMNLNNEYKAPTLLMILSLGLEMLISPIFTSAYVVVSFYSRTRPKSFYKAVSRFWDVDESTKQTI